MELKGKRLLILGGSRISCEIIRHARAMGIVTGVTDWYPLEKSPAKQMADEAYYVSTSDIDAMADLIREKRFDGVFTGFTDSVLPYYAQICRRTGLPAYGTREQFEVLIDKKKYKDLLRRFDVPTIPEYQVDLSRFEETSACVRYPVLVKPVDSSGSRGISICGTKEELEEAIATAEKFSQSGEVLVEQYIDGPEATVFWIFADGEYHVALMGDRHVKKNQEGVLPLPVAYTYPSVVQPRFLAQTAPKMEAMFRALEIRDGMMFMQCKVVDGVCLVYDIGYRLTGSLEYINIKAMCGYDPMDMLIRFALTGSMGAGELREKADPALGGHFSYNVSLLSNPGKIARLEGLQEIRALPGVLDAVVAHPEGDELPESLRGRLAQITVRVLGRAETKEEMEREMLEIHRLAHIISDDGEDLLLPGLTQVDFKALARREAEEGRV